MIVPDPGTRCACGEPAVSFHPYCPNGFGCSQCISAAQRQFNIISESSELELFVYALQNAKQLMEKR